MSDPTLHQQYQAFPKLDSTLIDEGGRISIPWYQFLVRLWQACGLNFIPFQQTAVLTATTVAATPVTVFGIGPDGAPTPIGDVPIPGSAAADQIIFDALRDAVPQDPAVIVEEGKDVFEILQAMIPPDPPLCDPLLPLTLMTPGAGL